MEEKEVLLTSVEQLNEYLNNSADERSVISIVLELSGNEMTGDESGIKGDSYEEGGDTNG